ncbi:hypothetical protein LAZ67_4000486 [Cordylochernes scorpioides]|uniref:CCHC-type domain-containing protein n=1 Tax=Cordylochernes scorpioides TaxID=51811 RepID=A0ABY6KBC2_9ARAC|nr:hypothetical protein LAZ67_4000486 [Cordylochernes scorpioides]
MSSLYQIEKLNKQNFETWRLQMQMILVHSDLWIYVNEANIKPEPGNQEFTNWQNKDQKALATIVLSLNPSELVHVKNCKTAEEAWKKIEEVYRPKGPATRVSLTKRLIQMKMRPNDDLKDYLSKFTSLVDNLGEIGAQVPEDFLVILLLCSLPESYEGFRTAIETRDELPKLETLKVKTIEEDQRQREMEGTSSGEQNAFFGNPERKTTNSTKPPTRKDFKFNCHYCGKKGHKAADCWSKRNSRTNNTRMAASLGIRDENILDVNEWCLDSGATAHMCCLRTAFSDLRETEPIPVKLANDQSIEALGTGTAYRLWKPGTGMMIKSRDVRFLESENSTSRNDVVQIEAIPQKKVDISLEEESLQDDENTLPGTDSDFLGEPSETMEVISQRGRGRPRYIRTGKPGRPRKEYPTANLSTQEFSEVKYSPDPKDAEEALSGKDSYFWRKAMKEEFDSLIENKTWELVDPPKGQNVIGSKWVFRRKYSSDGSLERYKARLVAKGYSQKYGIDYEETFAPVVRHSTIRTVLALAVEYDLLVHQMDVQSAFLNGDVKEEIYMTQPENFESKKYPRRVCKLKKAIYGLKQAGMTWHAKLDSVLKEMGLEQMKTDNCVYIKHHEGILLVAIYVDDLIIAAEREDTLISFKESMKKIFKIKDLGKINYCLGIRIQTEKDGSISIDQEKYIEELLAKYRMKEAKPISTPMDSNSKLTKISSIEVSTRPDIAYAVSALGQFSNDPRRQHWNAAKRVLRYLKGTLCLKITYEKTNETLYGCVDADWGGNLADRKSQTGLVFFLARGPIAWESKKQQTVALSSTESEYIALCEAGKEAVYLRTLLDEMGFGELLNEPTVLKTDNQGAQQLARNPVHHARTKHIDIKWHYIRSICSDGLIEVVHIPTQKNVADILTKGLPRVLTISRRLVANGLHSCRPLRRLPLTPPNRRQRLEWCRARSTWMTEWHRVVFSDESRFCLSSDSRRVRVWRRRGERSNPAAIVERPTVRQRGIMVWGAIAYDSRSPLLRIQGAMTAQRYVDDVLRPVTLPYLQGVPNALYQQDNARPHTARISQQALQDVQMLPWPPYSPDLSPIEHVWDIIGRRLHALPQPRSEDELWQMVEREWRAIPQDAIRTLIDSLPRRVAACIAVRGGPTCY